MNLSEYPAAIETARLRLQELTSEVDHARQMMGEVEDQITANVASALADDGKPLYSNETKRKAAITSDLKTSNTYQAYANTMAEAERERVYVEAKLERLRNEFAVAKIQSNEKIVGALTASAFTA